MDHSEAQEGDPRYLAPELMCGKFGKPADIFRLVSRYCVYSIIFNQFTVYYFYCF